MDFSLRTIWSKPAFCSPLRSRGDVTAGDRGVMRDVFDDSLVLDPRRFAATPYFAGGDKFLSVFRELRNP
jgi:hypothetical protein